MTNIYDLKDQEEIWVDSIEELEDSGYSAEDKKELEELYSESMVEIKEEGIVEGRVTNISPAGVAIDIGFKSEGIVPISEFEDIENLNPGDEVEVYLDSVENEEGNLVLSRSKAKFLKIWNTIKDIHEKDEIVKGICQRRVKGGIVVDLMGIDAFLPGSQIDVYPVRDFDAIIGKTLEFKIVKLNEKRKNVVISRKIILEGDLDEKREKTLKELQIGDIKEAIVKNITDFGVFIEVGGVDGLIYITDLSWGRVYHPSEICKLDETINVKILDIDYDKRRLSAGLKQLQDHPWDGIEEKYPEGEKVTGKVVSITDYGAFIEIEKGIEGLIHISEMSWVQHVKHPSSYLHLGDLVEAVVLNIKKEDRKISLGLKQLEPDPWEKIENKYPVGSTHKGIVRNLTAFGAFVEIEEGIDGLVHISDLSWTKKVKHPKEIVKKGDEIEVVVLEINKTERRIALGYKHLTEDPWPKFAEIFKSGEEFTVTVTRKEDKGYVVSVTDPEVEALIPFNMIETGKSLKSEQELKVVVVNFDQDNRKISFRDADMNPASVPPSEETGA